MTGTGPRRYHPFFALGFMRRTLLLYLVPLVQVLFAREWQALWRALAQDLALFCLLALVSAVMLRASSWELDAAGVLHLRWDLILSFERRIQNSQLAAVQIERPMLYCLAGASRVTLYPALLPKGQAVTLHLTRRDARMLTDRMMPAPQQEIYHPAGGQRLAFALLGANSLSTLLLVALALRQGDNAAEQIALEQINQAAAWAARWLPAGLAWALTAWTFLFGLSLVRSFSHTLFYRVWRGGGVLASRGGLLVRVERRFRLDRLTCAEVRLSPGARLLRCYPVYLTAGCCNIDAPGVPGAGGWVPRFSDPASSGGLLGAACGTAPAGAACAGLRLLAGVRDRGPAAGRGLAHRKAPHLFASAADVHALRVRLFSRHRPADLPVALGGVAGAGHPDLCLSRPPAGTGAQHPAVRCPGLRGLFGKE